MSDQQPFSWANTNVPVPSATVAVVAEQWQALAVPGSWWTGEQRVGIAEAGRAAKRGLIAPQSETINQAARAAAAQVAAGAGDMTQADLDKYATDGLDPLSYVELVGIVARTTAIDTATIGLGAELQPFPMPIPGDPTRPAATAAKQRSAWVPTVGAAGATTALSAVPTEDQAQEQLHGALYLSYHEMGDYAIAKALSRPQMELLAARTSRHNDCYF